MIKHLKQYQWSILIFFLITILYFLFRLPNLTLQPIFADEAIYVRWAQVMRAEPTLRFLPLSDGKTPLYMWILMPVFKLIEDPLLAGRLLSIVTGFGTLLGVFLIGLKFFNIRVGLWGAFLIASTPFMVFFDRMALVDSMLATFTIWSLFLALWLVHSPRLDLAMILGFLLGGGIITKTPGMFNFLVVPVTVLAFGWRNKNRQSKLLKLFGLWVIAIGIGMVIYNMLRLGPEFNSLSSRNQDYTFSPLDLIGRPLDPFMPHFRDVREWFLKLLGVPLVGFIAIGIGVTFWKKNRIGAVILFWSLIPLLIEMALLKTFTARYILFTIPPLLVLGALGCDWLASWAKDKVLARGVILFLVVLAISVWSVYFNLTLLTKPENAPLPKNDRRGYFEDWTAGYGFKEIAEFLAEEARSNPIIVGTEGFFGTLPDGLQIYLDKNRDVTIIGSTASVSAQLRDAAKNHPTYFITNKNRYIESTNVELLQTIPKAKPLGNYDQDAILLFKVKR